MNKPNGIELNYTLEEYSADLQRSNRLEIPTPVVACFGGSSMNKSASYWKDARNLTNKLAGAGVSVITGGGTGIMGAANAGAYAVGPEYSYGLRVEPIKDDSEGNSHCIDDQNVETYRTLSIRLLTLISKSDAIVFFPGGFGTLEEMFSLLVRIKVKMMENVPTYFYDAEFWNGLKNWLKDKVLSIGLITPADMKLMDIRDNIDEIADEIIKKLNANGIGENK